MVRVHCEASLSIAGLVHHAWRPLLTAPQKTEFQIGSLAHKTLDFVSGGALQFPHRLTNINYLLNTTTMRIANIKTHGFVVVIASHALVGLAMLNGELVASTEAVNTQPHLICCVLLLCLSGSWNRNPVCSATRAGFVGRAIPYLVELPLQIWNRPMDVSYQQPQRI